MPFHIGLLLFPDITQLDMTGPYEVFIKFPDAQVHLIWKTRGAVTAGGGMQIMPEEPQASAPRRRPQRARGPAHPAPRADPSPPAA